MSLKISKPIPAATKRTGPPRWETLYDSEYTTPDPKDYSGPKEGGGWFRHPNKAPRNVFPFKTDTTLYNVEYSRIKIPERWDMEVLPIDTNDPYIKYRKGFPTRVTYDTSYSDMSFLRNKIHEGAEKEVVAAEEYAKRRKKEEQERKEEEERWKRLEKEFQEQHRLECGHPGHVKPVSDKENPDKYPKTMMSPENVEHDHPFPPVPKEVYTKPERVTEDDMRNEVQYAYRGTKGFFSLGSGGVPSIQGQAAADAYYGNVRPFGATLAAMDASKAIGSRHMC